MHCEVTKIAATLNFPLCCPAVAQERVSVVFSSDHVCMQSVYLLKGIYRFGKRCRLCTERGHGVFTRAWKTGNKILKKTRTSEFNCVRSQNCRSFELRLKTKRFLSIFVFITTQMQQKNRRKENVLLDLFDLKTWLCLQKGRGMTKAAERLNTRAVFLSVLD